MDKRIAWNLPHLMDYLSKRFEKIAPDKKVQFMLIVVCEGQTQTIVAKGDAAEMVLAAKNQIDKIKIAK